MLNDREKLIELIRHEVVPYFAERIADHLIANNVVVREKGEWKWEERNRSFWWRCSVCDCTPDGISDFCPACGADMRGAE